MKFVELISFLNPIHVIHNYKSEISGLDIVFEKSFSCTSLGWISNKNKDKIEMINRGFVIISNETFLSLKDKLSSNVNWIIVDNPRKSFADVIEHFFISKENFGNIHPTSVISQFVIYNSSHVNIGPNVVIEDDVVIENNVVIGPNTVIKKGTIIKENVIIGSNCTIGGIGFGYEKDVEGNYKLIHHIGNVIISESVEIGNNVCIDRAVIGSTFIGKNVKIDNLVHIAHGVKIDENSLIIANAVIGGSVSIGKNVWISPSVSIRQKLNIQDNSLVGIGSVVVKDVLLNDIVAGVPAKSLKK